MKKNKKVNFVNLTIIGFLLLSNLLLTTNLIHSENYDESKPTFNVLYFGAKGDGKTLDSEAIQKAIDEASKIGNGAKVLIPKDKKYLIGTLVLKSGIDFHLEGNAELFVSTNFEDYNKEHAVIYAYDVHDLSISGTGTLNGRAMEFMSHYEEENEWWIPNKWRPKLINLIKCKNLKIEDISIEKAPLWSVHLLGCEDVLIDGITINNDLDVPNCDGIDPDHCRNVIIKNCNITCGDDAIVIKATRQNEDFGPSSNIRVSNCTLKTQDSGLKIGTETTNDIYDIIFESCEIISSCRGLTIQLRDEGDVHDIIFREIKFKSQYHSAPWWGRGEAISFTAIPRNKDSKIGKIENIFLENIEGLAENSIRINGTKESIISNVNFKNVKVTLDRWSKYPGKVFDNRPTKAYVDLEEHVTSGINIRFSKNITLEDCTINWGDSIPAYFTNAIYAHDTKDINLINFNGEAAFPDKYKAVKILEK